MRSDRNDCLENEKINKARKNPFVFFTLNKDQEDLIISSYLV